MLWLFKLKPDSNVWRLAARLYVFWFQFVNKRTMDGVGEIAPGCDIKKNNAANAQKHVTIIVPVYNAYEELKNCIKSVISKTRYPYRLLIIDDASSDDRISTLLASYSATYSNVCVEYNKKNLGYTATINKGCGLAGVDDVVLLNSDTQVTEGWLKKLSECARSNPRTATVTPLSNAAGVFSVPVKNSINEIPGYLSVDEMGEMVERLSLRLRPRVPTGNGYCMYVTRSALDIVGNFDETNFSKGYGEENDFCMRAGKRGFLHFIEDSTYIYHKRAASFKETKKDIIMQSMKTLTRMHPEYKYLVLKWIISDPLDEFRKILKKSMNKR
ncbi:MAG: glycosyltransferase family 2 protein [Dissulfuribacterales bacterium]